MPRRSPAGTAAHGDRALRRFPLVLVLVRHPDGVGAGTTCDALVYNHDLTATRLNFAGIEPKQPIDGIDFWPGGTGEKESAWGDYAVLYDVSTGPQLERNLAEEKP